MQVVRENCDFSHDIHKSIENFRTYVFGSQIRGILSDLRSDESFPVKTGSYRKVIVDVLIETELRGSKRKSEITEK